MFIEIRQIGYSIWELLITSRESGPIVEHIGDFGNLDQAKLRARREALLRNAQLVQKVHKYRYTWG